MKDKIDNETEAQIRKIAREEAQEVFELGVRDPDGTEWSLSTITERFGCSRRTALKAMGLIALGATAPTAILRAMAGTAQAAPQDDLVVPGKIEAGDAIFSTLSTDGMLNAKGRPSSGDISLNGDTRIPAANIQLTQGTTSNGGDTFSISQNRTCNIFCHVRVDGLNSGDRMAIKFQRVSDGLILAQTREKAIDDPSNGITWLSFTQSSTLEPGEYEWIIWNQDGSTRGTIKQGNQNTNLSVQEQLTEGANKPTR